MNLIFAKWFFYSTLQLVAGPNNPWPVMPNATLPASGITTLITSESIGTPPCLPGAVCPPQPIVIITKQLFCVTPGVYRVDFRLGLKSAKQADSEGNVWLVGPGNVETLLVRFYVEHGQESFNATSMAVATEIDGCYRLRYDATAPAKIITDSRYTSLTISR